jgi:hypothetical protein
MVGSRSIVIYCVECTPRITEGVKEVLKNHSRRWPELYSDLLIMPWQTRVHSGPLKQMLPYSLCKTLQGGAKTTSSNYVWGLPQSSLGIG